MVCLLDSFLDFWSCLLNFDPVVFFAPKAEPRPLGGFFNSVILTSLAFPLSAFIISNLYSIWYVTSLISPSKFISFIFLGIMSYIFSTSLLMKELAENFTINSLQRTTSLHSVEVGMARFHDYLSYVLREKFSSSSPSFIKLHGRPRAILDRICAPSPARLVRTTVIS